MCVTAEKEITSNNTITSFFKLSTQQADTAIHDRIDTQNSASLDHDDTARLAANRGVLLDGVNLCAYYMALHCCQMYLHSKLSSLNGRHIAPGTSTDDAHVVHLCKSAAQKLFYEDT